MGKESVSNELIRFISDFDKKQSETKVFLPLINPKDMEIVDLPASEIHISFLSKLAYDVSIDARSRSLNLKR